MRKQRAKAQVKKTTKKQKQKLQDKTHPPVPPPTPCYKLTTPHLLHPPIICYNNTIDIELLVQMRRSD